MPSDLINNLIGKGYFPQEITPWFGTEKLVTILDTILTNVPNFTQRTSKPCRYSIPKGVHSRRVLSIPNPLHQIKLCKVIDDDWSNLRSLISNSRMSLTIPSVRARSLRALSRKFSFSEISEKVINSSTSSRFLLRTDISRYYPTIYTHSIPWAIHTKPVAKVRKRDTTLIGNRIDSAIQSCQDGQTNGIPIGPDTSLLISEILCSSMDNEVQSRVIFKSAFRYIDDYFLFFDSLSDAEKAFSELHKIIRGYELELNPYKTKIIRLPEPLEPQWVSALNSTPKNSGEILSYISEVFEYSKKYPNDEVLKFGLSRIKALSPKRGTLKTIVSFILNVIMYEPSAIPLASEMLVSAKYISGKTSQIEAAIHEALMFNSEYGYEFEVTWLLWLCGALNISIDESVAKKISLIDNSFVALAALELKNKGKIDRGLDVSIWANLMKAEELYEENWLLAYEANVKGWLPSISGSDYVMSDPFFRILKTNNIRFFNPDALNEWKHKNIDEKWLYSEFSSAF